MKLSDKIAEWIKAQVQNAGKKGVVLGLSGGIDSVVVAALAKKALGDNALGVILPCESNPDDEKYGLIAANKFNVETKTVVLDEIFDKIKGIDAEAANLAKANLKPRLRMLILYYFANNLDYLVAGTGNKSELTVGYFTKYGDGGVDILPLGSLLKTQVRELAVELGVPDEIIKLPPSAGLWANQTDEGEMGITYDQLDEAIVAIEAGETDVIKGEILEKVKKMMASSEHKRVGVPIFKM